MIQKMNHINADYGERMMGNFFEGFTVEDYCSKEVFQRLGAYIGHGLCYEASALIMLIWKNHPSRLVYGECCGNTKKERLKHCWVEVKYGMNWYVIDSTWASSIQPRPIYYRTNNAKVDRVVEYDEFWGFGVSNELYERMKQPETAYIFWFLMLYRRIYSNQTLLFLDDCPDLVIGDAVNLFPVDAYSGTDGKRYPITHEILRDYVMNDRLVYPRRRMISRGRRFGKIMRQAHDEAAVKYSGKDVEITISLKGYEIQEVAPS